MKKHYALVILAVAALACNAAGEGDNTRDDSAKSRQAKATSQPTSRVAGVGGVRIDPAARRVTVNARVCLRSGLLEFLLCKEGTKEHESILHTKAEPSQLHAALLALGLAPGKPAGWSDATADQPGRFLPPRGALLRISLHWTDDNGRPRRTEPADWLMPTDSNAAPLPSTWIFVGSQILPDNRYWADSAGDVISVANFASSVIDVPFESSNRNAMLSFTANTSAIPPVGTPVDVVITAEPAARRAPHARALLEIDRFGQLRIDSEPITPDMLGRWAGQFVAAHAKGQVVIRADGRALTYDMLRARRELRIGGVRDFVELRLEVDDEILPRTPPQAERSLREWARRFAHPFRYITDPGEDAEAVLKQIDRQIRQLEALQALWMDYAAALRSSLDRYKSPKHSSDQPANGQGR